MSGLPFATFWHGPLNALVYSCLASFPRRGADLTVFCYEASPGAPPGVEVRNAREICPDISLIGRYLVDGRPSLATFSDRFRYELLARTNFCWVDADFLCLDPSRMPDTALIWGRQPEARGKALINNAVLRLPRNHPVLETMLTRARDVDGVDLQWGAIGPFLLTEVAEAYDVELTTQKPDLFYPIAPDEFWRLLDPSSGEFVEASTSTAALLHLWSELLRRNSYDFDAAPPAGSYLYERLKENDALPRFHRICDVGEVQDLIARWRASAPTL